jgi:hypothetical protein
MQHYACGLLQDLYLIQQHVFHNKPVHEVQSKLPPLSDLPLFFTTLIQQLEPMTYNSCFSFSHRNEAPTEMYMFMLLLHCPNAKTLKELLNRNTPPPAGSSTPKQPITTTQKKHFTIEDAKLLKKQYPNSSISQLVTVAVDRFSCGQQRARDPQQTQLVHTMWYLPDQCFSVLSPYLHVIASRTVPSFSVGQVSNKYCCFTNKIKDFQVDNEFKSHEAYCAALHTLFPPTISLSVKYQHYTDTDGALEKMIKTNVYTL